MVSCPRWGLQGFHVLANTVRELLPTKEAIGRGEGALLTDQGTQRRA